MTDQVFEDQMIENEIAEMVTLTLPPCRQYATCWRSASCPVTPARIRLRRRLLGFAIRHGTGGNIRDEDFTREFEDVKVVVDEVSINYLRGATVDYVENVMGSGFKIENPNAVSACGCGSSFRTKNDDGVEGGGGCASCG